MENNKLKGLYVIIDKEACGERSVVEVTRAVLEGGARVIQLRDKISPSEAQIPPARQIKQLCQNYGALFIVNDHADVAKRAEADGVHLGQTDTHLHRAREILGKNRLIGLSTHSIEQAKEADLLSPDYIAFGPIFETTSKKNSDPATGLEALQRVCEMVTCPVAAIGGIQLKHVPEIINAGAEMVCVIAAVLKQGDVKQAAQNFTDLSAGMLKAEKHYASVALS